MAGIASGKPPLKLGDKWALVVGVSQYADSRLNLKSPAKDAQDFAQFLAQEANFAADHVKVLTDAQATKEHVIVDLTSGWLPRNVKQGDLVLVYFAGQGTSSDSLGGTHVLGLHDLNPSNALASGLDVEHLGRSLKRLNTDRIAVVIDANHATVSGQKPLPPLKIGAALPNVGELVIASASNNETAHDSRRYQNGIFIHQFMEGIRKFSALAQAFAHARDQVKAESSSDFNESQTPVINDKRGQGSELSVKEKPADPRAAS
jgi:uncharacterized caspase-like protein